MSIFDDINRSVQGNAYRWFTPLKEMTGIVPVGKVLAADGRYLNQTDPQAAYELMDAAMDALAKRDECIRRIKTIQADPIAMASPAGNERQTTYRMAWLKSYQSFCYNLKFAAELYRRHGLSTADVSPKMRRNGTLAFRDVSWTDWRSDRSTAGRAGYVINRGGKVYVFNDPSEWERFADEQLIKLRDQFGISTAEGAKGTLQGGQTMGEPLTTATVVLYCVIAIAVATVVVAVMHHLNISEYQEISKQEMAQVGALLSEAAICQRKYEETGDPAFLDCAKQNRELAAELDKNRTEREQTRSDGLDPFKGIADALGGFSWAVTAVTVAAVLYFAAPYLLAFLKQKQRGEAA